MEIGVRAANLEDREERAFVADAFARGICSSRRYDNESNGVALQEWRKIFDFLADRAEIVIAVREDDPSRFVGFAIFEHGAPPIIHYLYVKYNYRCRGYGTQILGFLTGELGATPVFSVHTSAMKHLCPKWGVYADESKLFSAYYGGRNG